MDIFVHRMSSCESRIVTKSSFVLVEPECFSKGFGNPDGFTSRRKIVV